MSSLGSKVCGLSIHMGKWRGTPDWVEKRLDCAIAAEAWVDLIKAELFISPKHLRIIILFFLKSKSLFQLLMFDHSSSKTAGYEKEVVNK